MQFLLQDESHVRATLCKQVLKINITRQELYDEFMILISMARQMGIIAVEV